MADDVPAYTPETWVEGAAPGISAAELQRIDDQVEALSDEQRIHNGGILTTDHPEATDSVRGFLSAADKDRLDVELALPLVVGFSASTNNDLTMTANFTTMFSGAFTPPADWTTYGLVANGAAIFEGGSNTTVMEARLGDGTIFGAALTTPIGSNTSYSTIGLPWNPTPTLSGNRTVRISARQTDAGSFGEFIAGYFTLMAFQVT